MDHGQAVKMVQRYGRAARLNSTEEMVDAGAALVNALTARIDAPAEESSEAEPYPSDPRALAEQGYALLQEADLAEGTYVVHENEWMACVARHDPRADHMHKLMANARQRWAAAGAAAQAHFAAATYELLRERRDG